MNPVLTVAILLASAALVYWGVPALLGRLQRGKKENSPKLDPGPDESRNADSDGAPD